MKILKKATAILASLTVLFSASILPVSAAENNVFTLQIEGSSTEIFNKDVSFSPSDSLYTVFERELNRENIDFDAPNSTYGHVINSIGGQTGVYPVWWHIYVNDTASEVGIDSITPKAGDKVVIYIGNDDEIAYPTFKFTPSEPKAGQSVTVNVSTTVEDYSNWPDVTENVVNISGVTIKYNDSTFKTDSNGNVNLTVADDGKFYFSAEKETKDSTYAIVRMPKVGLSVNPIKVDNAPNGSYDAKKLDSMINSASNYLIKKSPLQSFNDSVAIYLSGKNVPEKYAKNVKNTLETDSTLNPTNIAGLILGIKAAGYNPENFDGKNLVSQLYSAKKIGKTGLNGFTYSLLAFDCANFNIPKDAKVSRESLVNSILSYQKENGAFSLDYDTNPDVDMTAIAITALAPYKNEGKVKTALDKAVEFLSAAQKDDGGFLPSYSSIENSETVSQVIIALSTIGIDPNTDTRFIKNKKTPLDALTAFKNSDGGFSHVFGGTSDNIATAQALEALAAYKNFLNGEKPIFDMTSVPISNELSQNVENPKTGENSPLPAVLFSITLLGLFTLAVKKRK